MDQKGNDQSTRTSFCQKILNLFCPTCGTNSHSHNKQDLITSSVSSNPSYHNHNYNGNPDPITKIKPTHVSTTRKESKKTGLDHDEAFSDYINRAKIKIRTTSNVSGEEIASEVDGIDYAEKQEDIDEFSDYINRAKFKIRRTSSIGSKKLISFKRE